MAKKARKYEEVAAVSMVDMSTLTLLIGETIISLV